MSSLAYKVDVNENGQRFVIDKGMPVTQITIDTAREFVRQRRAEGVGNASINRSSPLSAAC
jgi:hypothetical protein